MSGKNRRNRKGLDPTIIVAVIGLISTVTVTLLNLPAIQNWWNNKLNAPSVSATSTSMVEPPAAFPSETHTELPVTGLAPFPTDTPFPSETPTQLTNTGKMTAQLTYNYATGNAPLVVTFNAHSSYLSYQDGAIETCEFSNVCNYSWDVRQGSTPIYGPESGGGIFSYTFAKKGDYTVVVYVCRGGICNFAAVSITAK